MSKICQEKFQVEYPEARDDNGNEWVSDRSARVKKGVMGGSAQLYNSLPPGSDGKDQELSDQRVMPLVMSGETDVSHDWNPEAVRKGYSRRTLRPTDDMYTREHNDAFYDEITVDGVTGFIERNNMLDRM